MVLKTTLRIFCDIKTENDMGLFELRLVLTKNPSCVEKSGKGNLSARIETMRF